MATKAVATQAKVIVHEKSPIENFLEDRYVKFEYHSDLPIATVDEAESLRNQARFQALISEVRLRYRDAMKAGSVFPACIGVWLPNGKVKILDGLHRYFGAKDAKRKGIPFYVIDADTDPQLLQILTYEANPRLNGQPPTEDERIQHAIHLVETGATQMIAATVTGVTTASLSKAYAIYRADRRAQELGILKTWNKLSGDQQVRINSVDSNPAFESLVKFTSEGRLSAGQVKDLVVQLKTYRSDQEKLKFIEDQREDLRQVIQEKGSGVLRKGASSARHMILMHVAAIVLADPEAVVATCFTDEQREAVLTKAVEGMVHLEKIIDILTEPHVEVSTK